MRPLLNRVSRRLAAWLDACLPPAMRYGSPEAARRARVAVLFALVEVLFNVNFAISRVALGQYALAIGIAISSALFLMVPLILRVTGSILLIAQLFSVCTWLEVNLGMVQNGRSGSGSLAWLVEIPLVAMLLVGPRTAIAWAAVGVATAATWGWLDAHAIALPFEGRSQPNDVAFATISLLLMLLVVAWAYESAKEAMRTRLDLANQEMRLVLDNVGQGFLLVERDGRLAAQHSTIIENWFGSVTRDATWWSYLFAGDKKLEALARLGWEAALEGALTLEMNFLQLPQGFERDRRSYEIRYRPIVGAAERLERAVLVLVDVTDVRAAERAQRRNREQADVLAIGLRDPDGFREFFVEARVLVETIGAGHPRAARHIHTLKGNCAAYDVRSVTELCQALEDRMLDDGAPLSIEERGAIVSAWEVFASWVRELWPADSRSVVVDRAEYDAVMDAIHAGQSPRSVERRLRSWTRERVESRFVRIARQAGSLAGRLDKAGLKVKLDAADMRLDAARWSPFWTVFVHLVRNALDHGIEPRAERLRAGKAPDGTLSLRATLEADELVISLSDDGRGIDWEAVRARAVALGLPGGTPAELEQALFADGLSTKEEVTEISGRGIGLGAVRAAVVALDGRVVVLTTPGQGSTWEFRFPRGYEAVITPPYVSANGRRGPGASKVPVS